MAISTAGSNRYYFIIHVEADYSKIILAMVIALWTHFIALASPLLSSPMRNVQWQLLNLNVACWSKIFLPTLRTSQRFLFLPWHYLDIFFMFKVAEHSFQEPIPNSPLLLSYLSFGARFLQESRLTTEEFTLAFWLWCELLPWQRG